ncbi:hypothetical protein LMH87_009444 [Akanthomyces muscarius]|uniref:Uncharacterized protein n=1 Tax=Akanthomyces muscarius TaxID=2231603 RepID=A0A9W8QBX3_AKAMU|nr:hypothetical protein LMH87_009444 [Akanthomyces muscarius]KAJ4152926.1 hypothetical protein LMH87_009444 [Akanthomyces muscarius]
MSPSYKVENLFQVKGLVAVITGGGSGLGAIAAHALADNGAKAVYILGRRVEALEKTKAASPNPDIIYPIRNPAAIGPIDPSWDLSTLQERMWKPDVDQFAETFRVNNAGAFYTAVAFMELLDEGNKRGDISQKSQVIFTTSIAGYSRSPAAGFSYAASKAGVTHMTKQLATTFAPYKIRVNAIAPGFYPSEMTENMSFMKTGKNPREEGALPTSQVPLQRIGTEEDFAGVILFLTSVAGGYIDGNVVVTDGGRISTLPNSY